MIKCLLILAMIIVIGLVTALPPIGLGISFVIWLDHKKPIEDASEQAVMMMLVAYFILWIIAMVSGCLLIIPRFL